MKTKLKLCWYACRYDVYYCFTWALVCAFIFNTPINLSDWRYWAILLSTVIFRLIGYKEGKRKIANAIFEHKTDINIDIKDKGFEPVICELKNIQNGLYFSLLNDEHRTKYLKCNTVNAGSSKCWNFDSEELCLIEDDVQCILYKTKTIYIPISKMKEDK